MRYKLILNVKREARQLLEQLMRSIDHSAASERRFNSLDCRSESDFTIHIKYGPWLLPWPMAPNDEHGSGRLVLGCLLPGWRLKDVSSSKQAVRIRLSIMWEMREGTRCRSNYSVFSSDRVVWWSITFSCSMFEINFSGKYIRRFGYTLFRERKLVESRFYRYALWSNYWLSILFICILRENERSEGIHGSSQWSHHLCRSDGRFVAIHRQRWSDLWTARISTLILWT